MWSSSSRRQFLGEIGAAAAGIMVPGTGRALWAAGGEQPEPRSRVIIARDDALTTGRVREHAELLKKMMDASMQKLTGAADPGAAWRQLFQPDQRVGIKINGLGYHTHPAVVDAIVAGLRSAGHPAEKIIIWDRFDRELDEAGFKLNKSSRGVACYGTDAEHVGSGYEKRVETNGQIGSCFSRIIAQRVDALISVPVLKDHGISGVSLGMKNFFGAIHNPNKYHGNQCDPYIADVVGHRYIRPQWKLTVCDATRGQYHGGPKWRPDMSWPFGGLLVGTDFVAVDAVGADILERERRARDLQSLADIGRPPVHIATAAARGFGVADLQRIQQIEI